MSLDLFKDKYAREVGFDDWSDLYRRAGYYDETIFFEHENNVIRLIENLVLENASINAKIEIIVPSQDTPNIVKEYSNENGVVRVNVDSIKNSNNLL